MLVLKRIQPDTDGSYFIDRNPKYFDIILDLLRNGALPVTAKDMTTRQMQELQKELDYYQIQCNELKTLLDPPQQQLNTTGVQGFAFGAQQSLFGSPGFAQGSRYH